MKFKTQYDRIPTPGHNYDTRDKVDRIGVQTLSSQVKHMFEAGEAAVLASLQALQYDYKTMEEIDENSSLLSLTRKLGMDYVERKHLDKRIEKKLSENLAKSFIQKKKAEAAAKKQRELNRTVKDQLKQNIDPEKSK